MMMILEKELLASPMQCVCRLPISNSDRTYTSDERDRKGVIHFDISTSTSSQ